MSINKMLLVLQTILYWSKIYPKQILVKLNQVFIVVWHLISSIMVILTGFFLFRKYAELFKWFKDFVGYKETNNCDIVPKKIETQEQTRIGDFATEIGT